VPSKREPDYWRGRLFKNTFTYKGRRMEVSGWAVKIQLNGRRKTFSLSSSDQTQAAAEACQIYQDIVTKGWRAVGQRGNRNDLEARSTQGSTSTPAPTEANPDYWKQRLIHRMHAGKPELPGERELSVRIEHEGHSQYFPLGTADEIKGSKLAMRIHQSVINRGWAATNRKFSRELTVALRWLDNPLAWSYATIHTRIEHGVPVTANSASRSTETGVAVIEPDPGLRQSLAWCLNHQSGVHCVATFADAAEALRDITRLPVQLALVNHDLPNQQGATVLDSLQRGKTGLAGLLYSVYEDSEHLFYSTPGGAGGYMLKRTAPFRLLEPMAGLASPLTREKITGRVREYFQQLCSLMTSGPSALEMAKLTPREHEILALLSKGKLAKEVADSLGISVWTVQGHIKNIFEKLNVHTRTEAVVKFLQK
jgi:DNA-binding NarL/FixJ family response regulator